MSVYDHPSKASLIWNDFKERLGSSCFEQMLFDLDTLIAAEADLSSLEAPFTHMEIDNVIKMLPNDKFPGPDGFNNVLKEMLAHYQD